jgi:hypothetical protein
MARRCKRRSFDRDARLRLAARSAGWRTPLRGGHARLTPTVALFLTGSPRIDADSAFAHACRERVRARLMAWLRRRVGGSRLRVFRVQRASGEQMPASAVREVPIDAILGTVEPSRARLFDRCFRPTWAVRGRWEQIWLAEHRGVQLPPISLMRVRGGYAVRDGHHRVSVARARGAAMIDAVVE